MCCNTYNIPNVLAKKCSIFYIVPLKPDCSSFLWSFPDVSGDLDSQTIEVLASWMLEHPLTEEQQGGESPRHEGAPDTPSSDGPETVQCPERPTRQTNERSGNWGKYWHIPGDIGFLIFCVCYFVQSVARTRLDREGELLGCPSN